MPLKPITLVKGITVVNKVIVLLSTPPIISTVPLLPESWPICKVLAVLLLVVVTCAVPALITALKLVVGGRVGVQLPGVDPSAVPPNQILSLRAFNLGLEAQQRNARRSRLCTSSSPDISVRRLRCYGSPARIPCWIFMSDCAPVMRNGGKGIYSFRQERI
jgi:hypothetical protein